MAKKQKETSSIGKIAASFFKEDFKTVKAHILNDVLVPKTEDFVKQMFLYAINEAASNFAYGIKGAPANSMNNRNNISVIGQNHNSTTGKRSPGMRERVDYSNIIIEPEYDSLGRVVKTSVEKKDELINGIQARISAYGDCTVNDLYAMLGKSGATQIDCENGWRTIRSWSFTVKSDGTVSVYLPRPIHL